MTVSAQLAPESAQAILADNGCSGCYGGPWRRESGALQARISPSQALPFLSSSIRHYRALAAASGMAAGAILSVAAIPIISQSFLVWQLGLSYIFLGRNYRFNQLFGCFLVTVGVVVTVASGSGTGSLMEAGLFWSILMIISFFLQAADTVLKEKIFLDAAQRLKGGKIDLFVVNSFGSAYQTVFLCLLLPFLSNLWGISFAQLSNYFKDGAACFFEYRCNDKQMSWWTIIATAVCHCEHRFQYTVVALCIFLYIPYIQLQELHHLASKMRFSMVFCSINFIVMYDANFDLV